MAGVEKVPQLFLCPTADAPAALLLRAPDSSAGPANLGPPPLKREPKPKEGSSPALELVPLTAGTRLLADPRRCVASELESSGSTGCEEAVHNWGLLCSELAGRPSALGPSSRCGRATPPAPG